MKLRQAATAARDCAWVPALRDLLGHDRVLESLPDRWVYARDRAPFATYHVRESRVPATLPAAIACPHDVAELQALVQFASERGIPLIPYGAGSGVLGGALPLEHDLVVDLKHLNRIVEFDDVDGTITVQAGMNGGQFEQALNERGYTCGHLPQSIYMSTVGGWAACRGAGQNSTRYGKIEDMVLGLKAVLPDGRELAVRPVARRAVGPSIKDLLIGSEGAFGFITELTLRIWRLPERREGVVLAFPSLAQGLEALRRILQAELRPAVVRLYDEEESRSRVEGLTEFARRPILVILEFSGLARLVDTELALAMEIVTRCDGMRTSAEPYEHWLQHRFESYSPKWQTGGHYMDTIEVAAPWSRLPEMHERMQSAVRSLTPGTHFGAHVSHAYPEGACLYMTLRLPPMPLADGLKLHAQAWDRVQNLCLALDGSISHHHGAGLLRGPWMRRELGVGIELLQSLKDVLDPQNLLVPGKLGLRPRPESIDIQLRRG